jgi:hypothetical protein
MWSMGAVETICGQWALLRKCVVNDGLFDWIHKTHLTARRLGYWG